MSKIIYDSVRLRCNARRAFEMFTVNKLLESWLTNIAEVKPEVGGRYELFWDPDDRENNSTIGCKVTAVEPSKLLSFEWKGPKQYKHFMNNSDPLTHVSVHFVPCDEASTPYTDVYLIHSGWRGKREWEEARQWTERAWRAAFEELRERAREH
ncbi:MAG: SRPBCC domain-containing protein [Candidatus Geothermarchaeales archaeon]